MDQVLPFMPSAVVAVGRSLCAGTESQLGALLVMLCHSVARKPLLHGSNPAVRQCQVRCVGTLSTLTIQAERCQCKQSKRLTVRLLGLFHSLVVPTRAGLTEADSPPTAEQG